MEDTELERFFSQVKDWPKSEEDLNDLASRVAHLLHANTVGIAQDRPAIIGVSNPVFRAKVNEFFKLKDQPVSQDRVFCSRLQNFGRFVSFFDQAVSEVQKLIFAAVVRRLTDLLIQADLESDIHLRNQFLSIASHELKTPLTSIYGILQLQERMLRLKREKDAHQVFPEQEKHHHFLKMVIRQVERLNELIDGLLDVSRIQNNRFMVEPIQADVSILLKDCTQNRLSVIAHEAGVSLHVDSVPQLIAQVDPVRIEEVINNLVMNAIRFSPEGGVIWIRLKQDEESFRLTVRDQGPSISLEDRERIFQPFERVQSQTRMGGLGLGLFISRQIAHLHGGNVSLVESVPGKGNVFEATFPLR